METITCAIDDLQLRWLIRSDLEAVADIEEQCFAYPWIMEDFLDELKETNAIGMVISHRKTNEICGYMLYRLGEANISLMTFGVAPKWQRRGVGARLMDNLKSKLSLRRRSYIDCVLSEQSLTGHLFLKSQGFVCVGIARECFEPDDEDGYVFSYNL